MKMIGVRDFKDSLSSYLEEAQGEDLVIMRHGHPVAVLIGTGGADIEDIYWGLDEDLLKQVYGPAEGLMSHEEVKRRDKRR